MIGIVLFAVCAIASTVAQYPSNWQNQQYFPNSWPANQQSWGSSAWPQSQNGDIGSNLAPSWQETGRAANNAPAIQQQGAEDDGSWKPDISEDNSGAWSPQYGRRRRSADDRVLRTLFRK